MRTTDLLTVIPSDLDWMGPEKRQYPAQITINDQGGIIFGRRAQKILPPYIMFAFRQESRTLYVRTADKSCGFRVTSAQRKYPPLSRSVRQSRVPFPAVFVLEEYDDAVSCWIGRLKEETESSLLFKISRQRKKDPKSARSSREMDLLLKLYIRKVSAIARHCAKSIPPDDRRIIAMEGFVLSFRSFIPRTGGCPCLL